MAIGIAATAGVAIAYDAIHAAATSEPFWSILAEADGPLTEIGTFDVVLNSARNLLFYISRLVWHPAPWSLALALVAWRMRGNFGAGWRAIPAPARQGLLFAIAFALLATLLVSPVSRYAERYAFPDSHAIACAGVVAVRRAWPSVSDAVMRLDRRIPAFPALVWLALALLRLLPDPSCRGSDKFVLRASTLLQPAPRRGTTYGGGLRNRMSTLAAKSDARPRHRRP